MTEGEPADAGKDGKSGDTMGSRGRSIESDTILRGDRAVEIIHGDSTYRLIRTKNDKLILTK